MHQFSRAILERKQQEPKVKRRLHFYARGEQIPLVAQGVWEVDEGRVQLSTLSPEGEEIWLGWAESSAFFGNWFSVLSTYQAIALSDVRLKWYSLAEINNSPYIAQTILPQLVRRMRQTEILLAISGQRRVEVRLQHLLLLLKREVGEPVPEGIRIGMRLTHQDLANAIGTTRVTVTRLLTKFKNEGAITVDSVRHIILKHDSFTNVADW
ncbi:Crp/Fnr family transcriptional regulator [Moorena sp. SIO3I6]|uniref:Crp/Fnr family transcriptional regulator n=1 Tax=Moorena sp. SIO3I6 TaxID=2607831 RepID=UPI0013FC1E65|nr:Crp/Fnr family transcriptional regulator [Moorena sp. SIO3I6]NEP23165.1 Crp/Fnr family transcriptional regulator [Moorena sp. SIO3I6]